MITGRHPWMEPTAAQINSAVLNESEHLTPILLRKKLPPLSAAEQSELPVGLFDLMNDCFELVPSRRPALARVYERICAVSFAHEFDPRNDYSSEGNESQQS